MTIRKAIFVVGPESSGSTYIAKVISQNLDVSPWSGRGFNCCDDPFCDKNNGYLYPCRTIDNIVCHRSVPYGGSNYPPIEEWKKIYNCYFVICTRDISISEISRNRRFRKNLATCRTESSKAQDIRSL